MIAYRMKDDKVSVSSSEVDAKSVADAIGASEWRELLQLPASKQELWKWSSSGDLSVEGLTPEELKVIAETNRQAAYIQEADPLFFKWQAGESTEAEWLAKREEIRARFPYPA
jgi:hypothetical protein